MNEIPIHNPSKMCMHVAGFMIAPGETRHIPEHHVPQYLRPKTVAQETEQPVINPNEAINAILALSIKLLTKELPVLSNDDLDLLEAAEDAKDNPRSGALSAIAEERIRRASANNNPIANLDGFALMIKKMDANELAEQAYPEGSGEAAIVDAEKQRRALAEFKADLLEFEPQDLESLKDSYADQADFLAAIEEAITNAGQT